MSEHILQQILAELQEVKNEQKNMRGEIHGLKAEMQGFKAEQLGMRDEMQGLKAEMQGFKDEMQGFKAEQLGMRDEMQDMKAGQLTTNMRLERIEQAVSDIPLIKQAVLEINGIVRNLESSSESFERRTARDLNHHDFTIDILNRRQLKLEAEVEKLKNQ